MEERSAGGDGTTRTKSCSFEQASTSLRSPRERRSLEGCRRSASWLTTHFKIDRKKIITEIVIKEDGCVTLTGALVEIPGASGGRALYLSPHTTAIEVKETLVILLDLCIECFDCQHLAFAVQRTDVVKVLQDFKWVGFTLVNPEVIEKDKSLADEYVFIGVDL